MSDKSLSSAAVFDSETKPLTGAESYVIHMDIDQLPKVDAYGRLTIDELPSRYLFPNSVQRWTVNRIYNRVKYNAVGSLDIEVRRNIDLEFLEKAGRSEKVPADRVMDGVDQSAFITGQQATSNRDGFMMFFDTQLVGMRYKNFKVLTHKVADGGSPIQKLAIPNIFNLTVNPDEDTAYNFDEPSSWVLYKVFMPKARELQESLQKDSVPFGAPLDFNPYKK